MECCPKEKLPQGRRADHGTVSDHETIGYVLIHPDHWDRRNNIPASAAFSKSKLKNTDLSIFRRELASCAQIQDMVVDSYVRKAYQKPGSDGREFVGILLACVAEIRSLRLHEDQARAICVLDDGYDGFESHGLLGFSDCVRDNGRWRSKSVLVAIRANLLATFERRGVLQLRQVFGET